MIYIHTYSIECSFKMSLDIKGAAIHIFLCFQRELYKYFVLFVSIERLKCLWLSNVYKGSKSFFLSLCVKWFQAKIVWLCPLLYNKSLYIYRRADVLMRNKQLEILEDLLRQINIEKQKERHVKFTYRRCLLESAFIGKKAKHFIEKKFRIIQNCLNWFYHVQQSRGLTFTILLKL